MFFLSTRPAILFLLLTGAAVAKPPSINGKFVATAYSISGKTASGEYTHRHIVAADPAILPIGSRIQIRRAGRYSGEYVVADTGEKIIGRKLDIYLPSTAECKKFGRKTVHVKLLERGKGTAESARRSSEKVKEDVQQDLQKGSVGKAATAGDWPVKQSSQPAPESPK